VMNELHHAYLNLGSNIEPEINLVKAVQLLQDYGKVKEISNAWESKAMGMDGPNYLNACLQFISPIIQSQLKETVIRPIEAQLGRQRSENIYTPRTIDIDIILFDDEPYNYRFWSFAFVIIPLAEIYPAYRNPKTKEYVTQTADRLRKEVWMKKRPEVLSSIGRGRPQS
jgi:2-amino-4-hydroxy-6-hydroxymethyldihydropteridine diphosphokinase